MSESGTASELRFEAPGPGSWEQDPVHFPRPLTRYFQETHPPSELPGLMRGSAVVSAGGSDEMERLKGAFAQDPAAREVLASDGDPAQVLASLRSLGGEAGAAVSGYLDLVGNREAGMWNAPSTT